MSNSTSKGYQFMVQNGQVTGVSEVKNGRVKFEKMDTDEAWSYDAATGQVSKTEWDHGRMETTLYSDANGDGIFNKVGSSYGAVSTSVSTSVNTGVSTLITQSQQEGYQFTVTNGAVTGVFEIEHGTIRSKGMDYNETWTVQANQVIKTELEHGVTETTVYADANGDGIFAKVSKTYDVGGTLVTTSTDELEGHHGSRDSDDLQGSDFDDAYHGEAGHDSLTGAAWFNQGTLYLSTDVDSAAEFQISVVGVSALTAADLAL